MSGEFFKAKFSLYANSTTIFKRKIKEWKGINATARSVDKQLEAIVRS